MLVRFAGVRGYETHRLIARPVLQISFKTRVTQGGSETWPEELSFSVLPATLLPYPPCTRHPRPDKVQICGTDVNVRDPQKLVTPKPPPPGTPEFCSSDIEMENVQKEFAQNIAVALQLLS